MPGMPNSSLLITNITDTLAALPDDMLLMANLFLFQPDTNGTAVTLFQNALPPMKTVIFRDLLVKITEFLKHREFRTSYATAAALLHILLSRTRGLAILWRERNKGGEGEAAMLKKLVARGKRFFQLMRQAYKEKHAEDKYYVSPSDIDCLLKRCQEYNKRQEQNMVADRRVSVEEEESEEEDKPEKPNHFLMMLNLIDNGIDHGAIDPSRF